MQITRSAGLVLMCLLLTVGHGGLAQSPPATLAAAITADPSRLSELAQALQAADPALWALLADPDQRLTMIAPVDGRFISSGFPDPDFRLTLDDLLADPDLLNALLRFHLLPAAVMRDQFAMQNVFAGTLLPGEWTQISGEDEGVRVGGAAILAEITTGNGTLWLVDQLVLPFVYSAEGVFPAATLDEVPRFPAPLTAADEATPEAAPLPALRQLLLAEADLAPIADALAEDTPLSTQLRAPAPLLYTVLAAPHFSAPILLAGALTPEGLLARIGNYPEGAPWSLLAVDANTVNITTVTVTHRDGEIVFFDDIPILRAMPAANGLLLVLERLPQP